MSRSSSRARQDTVNAQNPSNAAQALGAEQQPVVPAPFEVIANWVDLLSVAARVEDDWLSVTEFGAGSESVESYSTP
jgi:hypothetical protein